MVNTIYLFACSFAYFIDLCLCTRICSTSSVRSGSHFVSHAGFLYHSTGVDRSLWVSVCVLNRRARNGGKRVKVVCMVGELIGQSHLINCSLSVLDPTVSSRLGKQIYLNK